jgi:diketogulonate reductase-like aldo/keto reductase
MPREHLYITSKVHPSQQGTKESREAVETILSKLDCGYLNLILIHWPGTFKHKADAPENRDIRLQTWNTLIELQKEGKVRDIGVSNFLTHHLEHLLQHTTVVPAVNQFEIHPLLWEGSTIDFCRKHNIAIEAYSPLAQNDDKLFKNETMLAIANKHKKTVAQVSLRWSLQNGFITLPKSKTDGRIQENIDIYDFELSEDDMKQIEKLREQHVRVCWDPNNVKY